jgi:uncharacterized membrane protein
MSDTDLQILFGQIRTVIALAGGALVTHGLVSSGTESVLMGVITALIPLAWSWWDKRNEAQKTVVKETAAVNAGVAAAASGTVGPTIRPEDVKSVIKEFSPPVPVLTDEVKP